MPGVASFPALSRDAFLCLGLIKGSQFLAEAMVYLLDGSMLFEKRLLPC